MKASQRGAEEQGKYHEDEGPTGTGNTKEKVKKQQIYDQLVRRQMEHGLGSFWGSVLWIINEVEGDRGPGQKTRVTEASGATWSKGR